MAIVCNEDVWENIPNYEGFYEISCNGIVRSIKRSIQIKNTYRTYPSKIISTRINNSGYLEVRLSKNGKTKTTFVHRLLAQTFIPNPCEKKIVNHKNGIKQDNSLSNLEWVTQSENITHAVVSGLIKKIGKRVINEKTKKEFLSIRDAARSIKIPYSTCKNYLNGNRKNKTKLKRV